MTNSPIGPGGPDELAPDFPRGEAVETLLRVRNVIRTACKDEPGFSETGCGVGCSGDERDEGMADVGLVVDGRDVEVRIHLRKRKLS